MFHQTTPWLPGPLKCLNPSCELPSFLLLLHSTSSLTQFNPLLSFHQPLASSPNPSLAHFNHLSSSSQLPPQATASLTSSLVAPVTPYPASLTPLSLFRSLTPSQFPSTTPFNHSLVPFIKSIGPLNNLCLPNSSSSPQPTP